MRVRAPHVIAFIVMVLPPIVAQLQTGCAGATAAGGPGSSGGNTAGGNDCGGGSPPGPSGSDTQGRPLPQATTIRPSASPTSS